MKKVIENYDFKEIENEIKDFWKTRKLAQPNFKGAKNFTIVIPPPNVTGHLHLGHAWDGIIQDAIIRYKRTQHFNSLWIPGTDHAGIATQVKFEKYLKEKNIDKNTLGKEKFLEEIYKWKDMQSNFIHDQWNEMGFLLDYTKEKFTLDKDFSDAVLNTFVSLYKAGLIYEGYRLVNWDSVIKTAISDIEVIYQDAQSNFYYITYDVIDANKKVIDHLIVATTRPETMFGDVCLVVNPNDKRFSKYIGMNVINPANDEIIPIIGDEYVDEDFGTGVMKCTPAHDFNDYNIGKKHNLKTINILNDDATLNNNCPKEFVGLNVESARKLLVKKLEDEKHIDHIEIINNRIGHSERTGIIVQPYLTKQWFLKTSQLAKYVIDTQTGDKKVKFLPERFEATLMHWLNNMEDWCISRQLWWGHQLPIWYNNQTGEVYCDLVPPKDPENWTRSTDVLDTWYSSGLWPLSALGWDGKTDKVESDLFPTQVLVTGYDIIFFWVARMMMFSSYFVHESPFDNVYIHGLVKDEKNRKMSKSLGNGIEPQQLINEYGNDALRIFFLSDSSSGEDISYKPAKLRQAFNFLIKLWNTAKFMELKNIHYDKNFKIDFAKNNKIENWIINKLDLISKDIKDNLDKYSFNVAYKHLSDFIWDDYCNFYLECMKTKEFDNEYSKKLFIYVWKYILIMLQPYTPFLTEYLYQNQLSENQSILESEWFSLEQNKINLNEISDVEIGISLLNKIRKVRTDFKLVNALSLEIKTNSKNNIKTINNILEQTNSKIVENYNANNSDMDQYAIVINDAKFILNIPSISKKEYKNRLLSEIETLKNEILRSEMILGNTDFISKAKEDKILEEKEKFNKYKSELSILEEELSKI